MMRILFAVALAAALTFAFAKDDQLTSQQERMKTRTSQASDKELKGEQRQDFMSSCLKGEGGEHQLTAQQEKMKTCNKTASDRQLKGDERRDYMSKCLSADGGSDKLSAQQER